MSTEHNKANDRRFYEAWSQGNLAALDEVCAQDYVLHDSSALIQGLESMKQFVSIYLAAFPDGHFTIEDQIAEGDKIVTRWTFRGTHKGELQGIPPTDKQVVVTGISMDRVAGSKAVEAWSNFDALGMLQQLGVLPPGN